MRVGRWAYTRVAKNQITDDARSFSNVQKYNSFYRNLIDVRTHRFTRNVWLFTKPAATSAESRECFQNETVVIDTEPWVAAQNNIV